MSTVIILLCIYYFKNALENKSVEFSVTELVESFQNQLSLVIITVLLMPLNWSIESLKWKYILKNTEKLTFTAALKSVMSGVSFAIVTPNGIGDYGGRILFIKKESRPTALFLNGFLSLSQLLITVICGLIGYSFIQQFYSFQVPPFILYLLVAIIIVGYFITSFNFNFLSKFKKGKSIGVVIEKKERLYVLVMSFVRYLVFCCQFTLLLQVFGIQVSLLNYFQIISTIYLVSAIIPTGWFSNLLVRGSLSFYFFEQFGNFGEQAVVASSILWIINLLIPAIVGLFFIGKIDWVRLLKIKAV